MHIHLPTLRSLRCSHQNTHLHCLPSIRSKQQQPARHAAPLARAAGLSAGSGGSTHRVVTHLQRGEQSLLLFASPLIAHAYAAAAKLNSQLAHSHCLFCNPPNTHTQTLEYECTAQLVTALKLADRWQAGVCVCVCVSLASFLNALVCTCQAAQPPS